ncbi:MAG: hypothetical protein AAGA58_05145 [Verrucomicrobiota bacterium]
MPYLAGQIAIVLLPVALLFFGLGFWSRGFLGKSDAPSAAGSGLGSELRSQKDDLRTPAPVMAEKAPVVEERDEQETNTATTEVKGGAQGGDPDDFTKIKGIGRATAKQLHEVGIETYAQLADWPDSEAAKAGFADRAKKHKWREQAASLA